MLPAIVIIFTLAVYCFGFWRGRRKGKKLKEQYTNLSNIVQLSCDPPDDCNDPKVLKKYMKACFDEAIKE